MSKENKKLNKELETVTNPDQPIFVTGMSVIDEQPLTEEEIKKQSVINTGMTYYEYNQKGMDLYKVIENQQDIEDNFESLLEKLKFHHTNWLMLYCKDRSDFTIFHWENKENSLAHLLAIACTNRGGVIDMSEADNAIEIWIRDRDSKVNYCYYLFDYSSAIVEV